MLRKLLFTILNLCIVITVQAHYSIYSISQGVKIESGNGVASVAKKGDPVKANDYLIIPQGGSVEILNDLDKNIYKSTRSGKISVTRLMIDAKKSASDHTTNVTGHLRFGKKDGNSVQGEKIYVEKGMVRRSLAVFDPEAKNLQVDSHLLGQQIINYILNTDSIPPTEVQIDITTGVTESDGSFFRVENTLDFPIYFNVVKVVQNQETSEPTIDFSCLGQPDGCYVLLPGQVLMKENPGAVTSDERHLLVTTFCRYDLDEVVQEAGAQLKEMKILHSQDIEFPVIISELITSN